MTTKIGNLGIEALAGPTRLKARIQPAITGLDRQISLDLIPDFIPVVGYLDDIILVPLGIALAVRLIPPALLEEHRETALARIAKRPISRMGAAVIIMIWIALGTLAVLWLAKGGFKGGALP